MQSMNKTASIILGLGIFLGLTMLGYLLGHAVIEHKLYDRSVTVKGLSEREYPADLVIWPIQFNVAGNELVVVYQTLDAHAEAIREHLVSHGIDADDISLSAPSIKDKSAQQYGNDSAAPFRFTALRNVTVYSAKIAEVRQVMNTLSVLGQKGIVFTGDNYQSQTEYLFTRLNEIKPAMIEEATLNARKVAEKFAADSDSHLGKIKRASQGQFTISARDKNNPHIKKVRVVSTIEYYLSD
ncbi:SIMPL domain-containing protein [Photobacterium sp. MCCC 1A19761]|uniref:SIMPL domain-containing protein n=1 Tax=Photobacterium sp. MCCC 1A19761 TaxID=3115000 RepID=UPI00307E75E0